MPDQEAEREWVEAHVADVVEQLAGRYAWDEAHAEIAVRETLEHFGILSPLDDPGHPVARTQEASPSGRLWAKARPWQPEPVSPTAWAFAAAGTLGALLLVLAALLGIVRLIVWLAGGII